MWVNRAINVEYLGIKHHYEPDSELGRYEVRESFRNGKSSKWKFNNRWNDEVIIVVRANGTHPLFELDIKSVWFLGSDP